MRNSPDKREAHRLWDMGQVQQFFSIFWRWYYYHKLVLYLFICDLSYLITSSEIYYALWIQQGYLRRARCLRQSADTISVLTSFKGNQRRDLSDVPTSADHPMDRLGFGDEPTATFIGHVHDPADLMGRMRGRPVFDVPHAATAGRGEMRQQSVCGSAEMIGNHGGCHAHRDLWN